MTKTDERVIEYRGYNFIAVEHSPGWRVNIYPGPRLLHTHKRRGACQSPCECRSAFVPID
jgi:hypothetical protein